MTRNFRVLAALSLIAGAAALVVLMKPAPLPAGANAIDPSIPTVIVVAKKLSKSEKTAMDRITRRAALQV